MKRRLLILLTVWGVLFSQAQQVIDLYSGSLYKVVESTIPTRDIEELENGYLVTYTFDKALIQADELFIGTMFWKIDGFGMNETPGEPCTLMRNDWIAIPTGCSAKVEVVDSTFHDFKYELTPARQPLLNSNNEMYTKQNVLAIKPYNGFKPANVAYMSGTQTYRGQNLCQTTVTPIQYDYNAKTVRAYTSITYKVTFNPDYLDNAANRAEPVHVSCEDNFLNNNVIGGRWSHAQRTSSDSTVQSDVRDYIILSTNAYSAAANLFAEWKRLLGFNVQVILRDDWTSTSVMDTVTNAYTDMTALYYLLIIGDHNDVPTQQSSLKRSHVTDFHYGCIDNDFIPEIYRGRLSVSTQEEANNVIDKIISYEQNPPSLASFYSSGVHCAYFQDNNNDSYADRRFAQTSEDVRAYVLSQGKSVQRVYKTLSSVTPQYWNNGLYSNGEAIPSELRKPGYAWDGNSTNISNAINNGVFYVLHRDHGDVWGWGDPYYSQQHVSALSNGNLLPVVFSMNCFTGKFDDNCFAETFLRKSNGGCVAIYGASEISYSGYNDALTTGMFDAIWTDPGLSIRIPNHNSSYSSTPTPTYTLGQILGQGMVRLAETYGTGDYTKYTNELFHCFGDPSMQIYTECPTAFSDVSVVRNTEAISVALGSDETARITVYDPVSGEVQSYIGNAAYITTPNPNEAIICVSAHNRVPFIQYPDVMYIQNTNIIGTLDESHDVIKVGNHVTPSIPTGDVTTSNANITLRAREVVLDSGTYISTGTEMRIVNP